MHTDLSQIVRKNYNKIVNSIAFYPALIAIGFLIFSVLMLQLDVSEAGKHIKADFSWIKLRDASTARSIVSTIAAGIISLTVFSFSMVMILLNQAASQMSNRMLEGMIGNKFQQMILGIYIGTIVYALFLLSSIRNIDSGIYVPALSIYFLLLLTVLDIFLFIYFLHYVTQSVKFETIIERVHKKTFHSLHKICTTKSPVAFTIPQVNLQIINMPSSDYFQSFSKKQLIKFASEHNGVIQFLYSKGTYLLKDVPLLNFYSDKELSQEKITEMISLIDFYSGQPIEENAFYGYHQLAEVAIKALSPGINDPETAVLSMHAITDLFFYGMYHFIPSSYEDEKGIIRIQTAEWNFEKLFEECYYPIWEYGRKDRYIQNAMQQMIEQLKICDRDNKHLPLFTIFLNIIKNEIAENRL